MMYNLETETVEANLLHPAVSGFTTRSAGDMRKIQTIKDYLHEREVTPKKIVVLEQIHSVNVGRTHTDHVGDVEQLAECDGVVSNEVGACLTVRTADCVPALYYDSVAGVIGASHQGWRGTAKNMPARMIAGMEQAGAHRENIRMAIGPHIGMCCYTVDRDRYVQFMETMERFEKLIFRPHGDMYRLNLLRLNVELALEAGVPRSNIDCAPFCTACDSARFFSFRRHKATEEPFSEMMGFIMLP